MSMQEKYAKAKELVGTGTAVRLAAKQVGLTESTYYYYNSRARRNAKAVNAAQAVKVAVKRRPRVVPIPASAPEKVMVFVGSPSAIAEAARGLL